MHVVSCRSALDVLLGAGIDIVRSCEKGVYGTGLTRVLEGVPGCRDLYLNQRRRSCNDQVTPCCPRACGGLVPDL